MIALCEKRTETLSLYLLKMSVTLGLTCHHSKCEPLDCIRASQGDAVA